MVMRVVMELLRYSQRVLSEKSGMPTVMDQVPVLEWEEITSKVLFGFKLDTYHNTGNPSPNNKASADPKYSGYQKGAFGGFTYNYNGSRNDAKGSVYPVIRTIKKLNGEGPTDNSLKDYKVVYDGDTKVMTVTYNGQTWSLNLNNDPIAVNVDMEVFGHPNAGVIKTRIRAEACYKMRATLMKWPLRSLGRRVAVIIYSNSNWRSLIIQLRVPTLQ